MRAATSAVRAQRPARVIIAVPVAARQVCDELRAEAEEVVCALTPTLFHAVGAWYADFRPTSDEEVRDLLERTAGRSPQPAH
jgi:putative phosphoribosyl transferase